MLTWPEICPICGGAHALGENLSPCVVSLAHRCDVTGLVIQRAAKSLGMTDEAFNGIVASAWEDVRGDLSPAPSPITAAPVRPRRWWHLW